MTFWYPVGDHGDRGSGRPWYRWGEQGSVDLASGHPHGPSEAPWFQADSGLVYPTEHHPDGVSDEPWYRVTASFAYTPDERALLYQFRS